MTSREPKQPHERPRCGSRRTHGRPPCRSTALYPNGRCYHHGGPSTGPNKPAKTHGLYSNALGGELLAAYEYHKSNPNLLDLSPEIALRRACITRFVERVKAAGREPTGDEMDALDRALDMTRKLVESQHKHRYGETLNLKVEDVVNVLNQVADGIPRIIDNRIADPDLAAGLKSDIAAFLAPVRLRGGGDGREGDGEPQADGD